MKFRENNPYQVIDTFYLNIVYLATTSDLDGVYLKRVNMYKSYTMLCPWLWRTLNTLSKETVYN